jgi:hypothetical protein
MIPVTMLCIVMFAERQDQILPAKPNLLQLNDQLIQPVYFFEKNCV